MAKGTLLANGSLKTTKKSTSTASNKTKKSGLISSSATSTKKPTPAATEASKKKLKKESSKSSSTNVISDDDEDDGIVHLDADGTAKRSLKVNDPKWNSWYKTTMRESLEGMPLLHCEGQSKVETILKLFDLEAEYGPAVGMTRLERWERADRWGLNPPKEVYDILTTVEGEKDAKYKESLFNGMV